jgi:hypothetical protein
LALGLEFFSLREPRFKRFRQDKKAEPKDIPASQLFGCSAALFSSFHLYMS